MLGQTFGRLTVTEWIGNKERELVWRCVCTCGKTRDVITQYLNSGGVRSCGVCDSPKVEQTDLNVIASKKIFKNNTSGVRGVALNKRTGKWIAKIGFRGKSIHLGTFEDKSDAIQARKEAEEKYFKPMIEKYADRLRLRKENKADT